MRRACGPVLSFRSCIQTSVPLGKQRNGNLINFCSCFFCFRDYKSVLSGFFFCWIYLVCLLVEKGYGADGENFSFLFAERDARTLFVKNLPYRVTEEEMKNVFENAVEVRLVLNKEGSSKGYVEKL